MPDFDPDARINALISRNEGLAEALGIMLTAFAGAADTNAKREAIAIARAELNDDPPLAHSNTAGGKTTKMPEELINAISEAIGSYIIPGATWDKLTDALAARGIKI